MSQPRQSCTSRPRPFFRQGEEVPSSRFPRPRAEAQALGQVALHAPTAHARLMWRRFACHARPRGCGAASQTSRNLCPGPGAVPGRRTRPCFGPRRCAAARAVLLSPWREAFSLKNASRLRTLMLLPEQFLHLQNILTHNLADFRPFHHAPPFGTGISSVRTASPGSSDTSATTSEP